MSDLKRLIKDLKQENYQQLRSLLWQCKKWYIIPKIEALENCEQVMNRDDELLDICKKHLHQAEQLLNAKNDSNSQNT